VKVIIDLIEDIRDEIQNQDHFHMEAMLLKENPNNTNELIYAGEAPISSFDYQIRNKKLLFSVDKDSACLQVGDMLKHIMILDMSSMMSEIRLFVNAEYPSVEIIGFGKSIEAKKYILIIKI